MCLLWCDTLAEMFVFSIDLEKALDWAMSVLVIDMQYKKLSLNTCIALFFKIYKTFGIIGQLVLLISNFQTSGIARFEVSSSSQWSLTEEVEYILEGRNGWLTAHFLR